MSTRRFALLILFLSFCLPVIADPDTPPTYRGMVCLGWTKPESQALADGDSGGEELVVNTPLTEREKRELYYARQAEEVAIHKEQATENGILSHHHLLFPLSPGSDWLRQGPCGDTPMIRVDEYHITQFVPSNPKYPGDSNWMITNYYHADPAQCRAYFATLRKRAVAAKYGAEAGDAYVPTAPER